MNTEIDTKRFFAIIFSTALFYLIMGVNATSCPINPQWVSNFHDYFCVSNIGTFGLSPFTGNNIGTTNFVYLNMSNIIVQGIPAYKYSGYLWLQGYNGTRLVGNVTGYPYASGLLVPNNLTINNIPYNVLVVFLNQSIPQNTYYYANYSKTTANSTIIKQNGINNYLKINNNFVAQYNINNQYLLYSYLTPSMRLGFCNFTTVFTGSFNNTCYFNFQPNRNFYIYQLGIYPYENVSLDYVTPTGANEYKLQINGNSITTLNNSLTSFGLGISTPFGTLGFKNTIKNSTRNPFYATLEPSFSNVAIALSQGFGGQGTGILNYPYFINGYNIGVYSNYTMFNGLGTASSGFGLINPILNRADNATLAITIPNVTTTQTAFVIVPAYTSNYIVSNVVKNTTTVKSPFITSACIQNGIFCFNYAQQVTVSNWTYIMNTNANTLAIGQNSLSQSNTVFLKFTMPHYPLMGNKCQYVFFDQYNFTTKTDFGNINYTILNCNLTTATFILSGNTTNTIFPNIIPTGNPYYYFNVYWNSLINQSQTNSSFTINQWHRSPSSGNSLLGGITMSASPTSFAELDLNSPLTKHSFFWVTAGAPTGIDNESGLISINCPSGGSPPWSCSGTPPFQILHDTNKKGYQLNQTQYAFVNGNMWSRIFDFGHNAGGAYEANLSTSINGIGNSGSNLNWNGLQDIQNFQAVHLYSINFKINPNIINLLGRNVINNISTIQAPQTNASLISGIDNNTFFGNQSAFIASDGRLILFFGITEPKWYFDIVAIMLTCAFALSFMAKNEVLPLAVGLVMFCVGLSELIFVGNLASLALVIIALFYVLYYITRHSPSWFGNVLHHERHGDSK